MPGTARGEAPLVAARARGWTRYPKRPRARTVPDAQAVNSAGSRVAGPRMRSHSAIRILDRCDPMVILWFRYRDSHSAIGGPDGDVSLLGDPSLQSLDSSGIAK